MKAEAKIKENFTPIELKITIESDYELDNLKTVLIRNHISYPTLKTILNALDQLKSTNG